VEDAVNSETRRGIPQGEIMLHLRMIWVGLALTAALDLFEIRHTIPALKRMAGGLRIFDMRPGGYDFAEAQHYLEALGESGRAFYATWHLPADVLLASVEGLALLLAGLWLTRAGGAIPDVARRQLRTVLVVLPMATAALDLTENACIALMLAGWPHLDAGGVALASAATVIKWPAAMLSLSALAGTAVWVLVRRVRRRAASPGA
jgi:hypothetical protein